MCLAWGPRPQPTRRLAAHMGRRGVPVRRGTSEPRPGHQRPLSIEVSGGRASRGRGSGRAMLPSDYSEKRPTRRTENTGRGVRGARTGSTAPGKHPQLTHHTCCAPPGTPTRRCGSRLSTTASATAHGEGQGNGAGTGISRRVLPLRPGLRLPSLRLEDAWLSLVLPSSVQNTDCRGHTGKMNKAR